MSDMRRRSRGAIALVASAATVLAVGIGSAVAARPGSAGGPGSTAGPSGRLLYVGGFGSPAIAALTVGQDGALSSVPDSPFGSGEFSLGMAITPDARTVYSASGGVTLGTLAVVPGGITGYRINRTGSLTPLSGASASTSGPAVGAAIDPSGSHLFVTVLDTAPGSTAGKIVSYSISPAGDLTPSGAQPTPILSGISQLALSPDGRYLFVTNYLANSVSSFAVGPDAGLTPIGSPVPSGALPVVPVITPHGHFLYVSNEGSGDISAYSVGDDGTLAPAPGSPYASGGTTHGAAISADSQRVYVPNASSGTVTGWRIGPDGQLTALPGSPYKSPNSARVILSPDGHTLLSIEGLVPSAASPTVPGRASEVSTFDVEDDGSLAPSGAAPVNTGLFWHDGSNAFLTPNQGPVAALRLASGSDGPTRTFTAAGSSDKDGSIARYRWDFGDGTQLTTTSPKVGHRFASGSYVVTVTVTDNEGCSTTLVYNGTTVECRGGSTATTSLPVTIG